MFVQAAGCPGACDEANELRGSRLFSHQPPLHNEVAVPKRVHAKASGGVNVMNEQSRVLYLDDVEVGQTFTSESYVMDVCRIKEFAAEFDPQPFHIDETAAQQSVFHGLAASGWHTAAAAMRLLTTSGPRFADGILGLGAEISWPRPTRPGDVLQMDTEIAEIRPSQSNPERGIVTIRSTMFNQNGETAYLLKAKLLVPRRPR